MHKIDSIRRQTVLVSINKYELVS